MRGGAAPGTNRDEGRPGGTSPEVSVYDRLCWPDGQLQASLASGAHRRELVAYFGLREYGRLADLARLAARASPRPRGARAPTIVLLPGLLGSQLGRPRSAAQPPDLLWLDPHDVAEGRLLALRYTAAGTGRGVAGGRARAAAALAPLGAIPHIYLPLKLRLAAAGLPVVIHDYDWRCDLETLAGELAARLEAEEADELVLVGHSMGGLLARAALARCSPQNLRRIRCIVGLGTPHGGSIGAVQALRATYPALLRLAALDRRHDARQLAARVFRTFPSLYQMLPAPSERLDLFDPAAWPERLASHETRLLAQARRFRALLAETATPLVSIIGTGQRTVTGLTRHGLQFRYEVSAAGDGTVPAAHATLPGALDYSLTCEHSELPRSERVARALIDLVRERRTRELRAGVRTRKGRCVYVSDAMLRRSLQGKLDWRALTPFARRRYLDRLNAPPALYAPGRGRLAR